MNWMMKIAFNNLAAEAQAKDLAKQAATDLENTVYFCDECELEFWEEDIMEVVEETRFCPMPECGCALS